MWTRTSWAMVTAALMLAALGGIGVIDRDGSSSGPTLNVAAAQDVPAPPQPGDVFGAGDAPEAAMPEGAEVQIRGPVHEAFASPVNADPQPGPIVPKAAPAPIEEVAPDEKPEGGNVVWIPGYWAWDDEREDFLWISGLWRNMPPGRTWVPGYWTDVPGGHQWVAGFWTDAAEGQVNYLGDAPPQSLDASPSSPAPSDSHFWIPGYWNYYHTRYVWRPGYWAVYQPDWMWVPAHYVWCPSGYVFVPGYWDHVVARRGCLFAPVYFTRPIYTSTTFFYRPSVVFNIGFFNTHLFSRPAFCHYYVGDYYAASYVGAGFHPWFEINIGGRRLHDPLFTYYDCRYRRSNPHWLANTRGRYEFLRDHDDDRPPHKFKDQKEWLAKRDGDRRTGKVVLAAANVKDAARQPNEVGFKLEKVSQDRRRESDDLAKQFGKFADERKTSERKTKIAGMDLKDGAKGDRSGVTGSPGKGGPSLKLPTDLAAKASKIPGRTKLAIDGASERSSLSKAKTGVAGESQGPSAGKFAGPKTATADKSKSAPTDWPRTDFDLGARRRPMILDDEKADDAGKQAADDTAGADHQPGRKPVAFDDQSAGLPGRRSITRDSGADQSTGSDPFGETPGRGLKSRTGDTDKLQTGRSADLTKSPDQKFRDFGAPKTAPDMGSDRTLKPSTDTDARNAAEYARKAIDPRILRPGGESKAYRSLMEYGRSLSTTAVNPSLKPKPAETTDSDDDQPTRTKNPVTHFGLGSGSHRTQYSLGPTPSGGAAARGPLTRGPTTGGAASLQGKSPGSIMPGESRQLQRPYSGSYPKSFREMQNEVTDPRFRRN